MKLLFNKANAGQAEVKALLGFMDADIKYKNLETDIELNTPYLIEFISEPVYEKIAVFYETDQTGNGAEQLKPILKAAQLYILLKAYLDYAANGDIIHSNNGRKIHFGSDQKTPWDWQIMADNASLERRAYKSLDAIIDLLTAAGYNEWKDSDQFKASKSLFLPTTNEFHKIYPINHSGQLYYRLVPFMADIEQEIILSILGEEKFLQLKAETPSPTSNDGQLLLYAKKITAYRVIERAWRILPEEMLGEKVNYKISDKDRADLRDKRAAELLKRAAVYERDLERVLAKSNETAYSVDQLHGIKAGKNHVNL